MHIIRSRETLLNLHICEVGFIHYCTHFMSQGHIITSSQVVMEIKEEVLNQVLDSNFLFFRHNKSASAARPITKGKWDALNIFKMYKFLTPITINWYLFQVKLHESEDMIMHARPQYKACYTQKVDPFVSLETEISLHFCTSFSFL